MSSPRSIFWLDTIHLTEWKNVRFHRDIKNTMYQARHDWVPVMNFVSGYKSIYDLWWLHKRIEREFESKMKSENTDNDYYENYEYNENLMSEIMRKIK